MIKLLSLYKYLFALSGIVLLAGIISLVAFGLKLGVDFKGGTITEIEFNQNYNIDQVREIVGAQNFGNFQLQTTGDKGLLIKIYKN